MFSLAARLRCTRSGDDLFRKRIYWKKNSFQDMVRDLNQNATIDLHSEQDLVAGTLAPPVSTLSPLLTTAGPLATQG